QDPRHAESDMTNDDFPGFKAVLGALAEVYDAPISAERALLYFGALSAHDLETVGAAVQAHIKRSKFFPKPAELIELIEGDPEDKAVRAWQHAMLTACRARFGQYVDLGDSIAHAAVELAGGWARVWSVAGTDSHPVEVERVRQDFTRCYLVALRSPALI